jgi:hypothetical protein
MDAAGIAIFNGGRESYLASNVRQGRLMTHVRCPLPSPHQTYRAAGDVIATVNGWRDTRS